MLEQIAQFIANWWDRLAPGEIVDAYEHGVMLRWGRATRVLEPGFHWKWPVAERVVSVLSCDTTMHLAAQPMTTHDDVTVTAGIAIKYSITDPLKFTVLVWDARSALGDVGLGSVCKTVNTLDYKSLVEGQEDAEQKIIDLIRRKVNKYGFKIHDVTFTSLARTKPIHLVQPLPKDMDN